MMNYKIPVESGEHIATAAKLMSNTHHIDWMDLQRMHIINLVSSGTNDTLFEPTHGVTTFLIPTAGEIILLDQCTCIITDGPIGLSGVGDIQTNAYLYSQHPKTTIVDMRDADFTLSPALAYSKTIHHRSDQDILTFKVIRRIFDLRYEGIKTFLEAKLTGDGRESI